MIKIKNVLYLGWLGKGNVGDDVLFELFKKMFYKYATSNQNNIAVNFDTFPIVNNYKIDVSAYDLIVLGGGSLIHLPYWLKICKEASDKGIPIVSWGTGFDHKYKSDHSLHLFQHINQYKSIYDSFTYLSVRGPFTKKLLTDIGVEKEIHEIGDPALFYASETFGKSFVNTDKNDKQILINWGTSFNNIFGNNELYVENELVKVIHYLLDKGYRVKIYPIWTEDIDAVKRLKEKVSDRRCEIQTVVYDARTTQQMIEKSYITINFKLHANIMSASVNRPFISLAYRGKCFDFAETVQCADHAIATDEVTADKVIHLVNNTFEYYHEIVDKIVQKKKVFYPRLLHSIRTISNILH
ncbi:polysaccharide pyruvyl transferase family protein [Pseudogracilibacillus auburnensis]|uniref:Polysaccharide pyruvyl transferase WcaK-like protein n=1 Tax=Pseudogracilibacillus auburnensis TaxID=1494959 RepID=A0A2V3W9A0_9BACI|nr:polysaccharide pyruvyl transferase family protein [Pseudogracilibacillus auburnensis]MBO1001195.1 polysaccharide pyruvyl transferase family protein [Pseudogracilibacillus auburnensis]PXW90630.1 polysaccharide pyruvyl transferase WcaK-like protein [Pseudogracilibacillus auburnensis]